jgi:hypothetical protein
MTEADPERSAATSEGAPASPPSASTFVRGTLLPVFLFALLVLQVLSTSCRHTPSQDVMNRSPHTCPPGSVGQIQPWGPGGWVRSCVRYEGVWEAWTEQRCRVRGSYHRGEKDGDWVHFDAAGHEQKREFFVRGQLVDGRGPLPPDDEKGD